MKRLSIILFTLMLTSTKAMAYSTVMANTVKGEYAGKADSLTFALIDQFMNKTKGTFYSTPFDIEHGSSFIYWQQAHAIDVLVYGYERNKKLNNSSLCNRYSLYMRRWYTNKANNYSGGPTGFENPFTDDMCWIGLTLVHISEALNSSIYANTAKSLFDNAIMKRAVEDDTGLWLPWNTDPTIHINACTLAPACLLAIKLYERYGNEEYLTYATKFYNYVVRYIANTDGRVEEPPLTYTQGTFAEACRKLFHITGQYVYRVKAKLYFEYAFTSGRCTNGQNILRDEGSSMDQSLFKAVLIPYAVNYVLDEGMPLASRRLLSTYIQKNANTLWDVLDKESYPKMYCPYNWTKPYDPSKTASMGAMASGASLLENCARMCTELTTNDDQNAIQLPEARPQERAGVYSLNGTLIRAPWQSTDNLPPGIYIINGKKVVKQ